MNQIEIEIVGLIAGAFTTFSFLPQVVKSWKTKSTKDIAVLLTILNLMGQLTWGIYGIIVGSLSLIVMSFITATMVGSLLTLKLIYG